MLVTALLTAQAISQEIVIEPTNGRAQPTKHVSRPAAELTAPVEVEKPAAKSAAKSTEQQRTAAKASAKKARVAQIAAKREATAVPAKPAVSPAPETLKSEAAEANPASRQARPAWAMSDTRDAAGLQSEISLALAHDPKLANSAIQVSVDDDSVTLEGRAAGRQEHLLAQRLALSYAWNRKLVDHIEVLPSVVSRKCANKVEQFFAGLSQP